MNQFQQDFYELLALLNELSVEYVIVGGYAVAFHGAPRFTGDLDVLIGAGQNNVERALQALTRFGFPASGLDPDYLLREAKILQMGAPPVQIHMMTQVTGVSWEEVWKSRVSGAYGDCPTYFVGRDALIANKKAAGRAKDLADVEALAGC